MRCVSTVRYSMYDLFRCEYCERIRAKEEKREKTNKSKVPTATKDQDSRPHKQTVRSPDVVATAPPQSKLKPKPKPNTVNDAIKPSCNGQVGSRLVTSIHASTGMIQPPSELDATLLDTTLLDTTLLDIAFNGCDDASSNDGKIKCTSEHTTAVNTVIEHQVESLRSQVHCQRELIWKLQQQLRSLLSVLGITEQAIQL